MKVAKLLFGIGTVLGILFVLAGVVGGLWPRWDDAGAGDQIVFIALLAGGGAALLAGLRLFRSSPRAGAVLVSLGAVAGALVLFWSVLVPLLAITLVVLSVIHWRRLTAATA